jgi:tetratricopeptide (TPR) repeat protein
MLASSAASQFRNIGLAPFYWAQASRPLNMERIMQRFLACCVTILALSLTGCATGASTELRDAWKLMLEEDYAGARDIYQGVLAEYPTNPYAHLNIGFAYQQLGENALAREHYEAAIEHGGKAEVTRVVIEGEVVSKVTTVADKGRENLQTLPN